MFQVPASKASIKQNRFEFEIDGKQYSVPKAKYLKVGVVENMEDGGVSGILAAFDEATANDLRELSADQFEALSNAWMAESGMEPGESAASGS